MQNTDNQELVLAASLMARPEYATVLYPPRLTGGADTSAVENLVAKAAINILVEHGEAYGAPQAMRSALADLPMEFREEDVFALLTLIPAPFDVELDGLRQVKDTVERAYGQRRLRRELLGAAQDLKTKPADEAAARVDAALREFRQGNVGRDVSTKGVLARMREGQVATRWKIGCQYLDEQNKGIGPDGKFGYGVSAQSEIIAIAAQYGTGKSRLAYNWASNLVDQGAVSDWIVGEENEAVYSTKLIAARFDIEKWRVEQRIVDPAAYTNVHGVAEAQRIDEMLDWYAGIDKQLYMHDGRSKANIFKFPAAKALLEEQVALHKSTHVIIDYVQIWKGEVSTLEGYAQELREFATRNNVSLILLSQIPNEAMKYGLTPGMLPAKGTGDWGQIATFGYILTKDAIVGQKEVQLTQVKGRDAGEDLVWVRFNVKTGHITEYAGVPLFMRNPDEPKEGAAPKGKRGK